MKTFSQLLSDYTERTGISDAELARHLGVRRQTIFRWKEGLTQRPRHRQDVLRLAEKLRLTPAERDQLLIAAGFHPEEPPPLTTQVSEESLSEPLPATVVVKKLSPQRLWWLALVLLLILGGVGLLLSGTWRSWGEERGWLPAAATATVWPQPASADETLLLISEFANYGGEAIGYNVAGRLQVALQEEMTAAGLHDVRVDIAPTVIVREDEAERIGQQLGAVLVIWGEYDSGRVVAYVTMPQTANDAATFNRLLTSPEELNIIINTDLPEEMRVMALLMLGQVHLLAGRSALAEAALHRALNLNPNDAHTLAAIYFYLALLTSRQADKDWDQVIDLYSRALAANPDLISARNNRGAAYLQRGTDSDLSAAISDFRQTLAAKPDFAPAHLNLALALLRRSPDSFDEALPHLQTAHRLQPDDPATNNALCWNLSLNQRPTEALPFCDQAVAGDDSGYSHDSRGLTLALLGRYDEAVTDFQTFLQRLADQDPPMYEVFAPKRQAWIQALQQGKNPFDEKTLEALKRE
ncbi:MAG: helix-turn-helix domain-containing protein [Chloroflexi bacterium]|nr:helix-turn-helix domain-containing protein [Chloroflexota bacterium]